MLVHREAEHPDGERVEEPSGSPRGGWETETIRDKILALERHSLSDLTSATSQLSIQL